MKHTQKQNLTINALLLLLIALFLFSGSLMWSQHHQYHNTSWMDTGFSQGPLHPMNWNNSGR